MIEFVGVQRVDFVNTGLRPAWSSSSSVISSLAFATSSPVFLSTTSCDSTRPTRNRPARPFLDTGRFQLANVLGGDALVLGDDDVAVLAADVEARHFATQALRHQFEFHALGVDVEGVNC